MLFPERQFDPLILSYRITGDENVSEGSVINLVQGVLNGPTATFDDGAPGIIITNPSQLYWYRGGQRAVSWLEWLSLPRPSAVHEAYRIDPIKNKIPGNKDSEAHVAYIFNHVLGAVVDKDAKIDIIALEWTGKQVIEYLALNCKPRSGLRATANRTQGCNGQIGSAPYASAVHSTRLKTSQPCSRPRKV